jgi:hypothetical protein
MTGVELECRWNWWRAALDFFAWPQYEAAMSAYRGIMWGEE